MAATRTFVRGLQVIEALAAAPEGGMGPSGVAKAVELDKATVTRLLRTLVETGYVARDDATRSYRLTGKIQRLAQGVAAQHDLRTVARPHLHRLRQELGETVHLGVMTDLRVVYVDKLESTNSIQLVSAIGQTMPLHSTSLGKAMLAVLPEAALEEMLARLDFAPRTDRTIRDIGNFREELKRTAERGYATDDRENEPFGACVAAAIIGLNGTPVASISVSGPEFRIRDRFEEFGERVRTTAAAIAWDLGSEMGEPPPTT